MSRRRKNRNDDKDGYSPDSPTYCPTSPATSKTRVEKKTKTHRKEIKTRADLLENYYEDDLASNTPFLNYFDTWKHVMDRYSTLILTVMALYLDEPNLCKYVLVYTEMSMPSELMCLCADAGLSYFEWDFFSRCIETIPDDCVIVYKEEVLNAETMSDGKHDTIESVYSMDVQIDEDVFSTGKITAMPRYAEDLHDSIRAWTTGHCSFSSQFEAAFNAPCYRYIPLWRRIRWALGDTPVDTFETFVDLPTGEDEAWDRERLYTRFSHLSPCQLLILFIINRIGKSHCPVEESMIRIDYESDPVALTHAIGNSVKEMMEGLNGEIPQAFKKQYPDGPTLELAVAAARHASSSSGGSSVAISINVD